MVVASLWLGRRLARSVAVSTRIRASRPGAVVLLGVESNVYRSTDLADLIGKSRATVNASVQHRNPNVTGLRVRGSRESQQNASGSYWVPARIDLDTALSKIDSQIIDNVILVKGPYSVFYGPGFDFVDIQLLHSPRFDHGFETHGSTGADYKTNGQQFHGRQQIWGGNDCWGFRMGYGHRTGNDYAAGRGLEIPSSYNSRTFDFVLGRDLSPDDHVEFTYLRLDQTGVELPGQAFDIDFLVTDGYEVEYVIDDHPCFDRLGLDVWYNRTRFDGSAQRAGKRRQFPFYDFIGFVGNTAVDSMSTGFRLATSWGCPESERLTAGVDLRYLKQELNEITSAPLFPVPWPDANSPIPRSYLANPGLFLEYGAPIGERLEVTAGTRVDVAFTDVIDDSAKLATLGTQSLPLAYILGSDDFTRTERLWAAYVAGEYRINCCWTVQIAAGYAERPPSLTELYAAESFMFVLQNGLNSVTGDPRLKRERLCQIDASLKFDTGRFRGGITGFHGWTWDYITFENMGVFYGPPAGQSPLAQLKYVNTDLATLVGAELHCEFDLNNWLTPFATLSYVDGRDRTRNGDFATRPSSPGSPSVRISGLPRGFFSVVSGSGEEPLPSIVPLESRLGIRITQPSEAPRWGAEISARVVDKQDRVATSLLETATPGFAVWDVRGYWYAIDDLLLVAGIENFTDKNYREHLDFRSPSGIQVLQPGANFYFGADLTY